MYKLFLTVRFLRQRRIAFFAIAAVTLCVAMVLVVRSVMGGWLDQVKVRARGLLGDIVVNVGDPQGFPLYDEFIERIKRDPELHVEAASPVIVSYGLLQFPLLDSAPTRTVTVLGIRLEQADHVTNFKDTLFYERFYPGTTHLDPQQQPVAGLDREVVYEVDGASLHLPTLLPEPYASALQESRSAGVRDVDSRYDEHTLNALLEEAGAPQIPGIFEWDDTQPHLEGEPLPGAILGRDLGVFAFREPDGKYERVNYFPVGSEVLLTVVPIAPGGSIDQPVKRGLRYADDSRTGIYDIDSRTVYVGFELLQRLLLMNRSEIIGPQGDPTGRFAPARASQVQIKLEPGVDPFPIAGKMEQLYKQMAFEDRFDLAPAELGLAERVRVQTWQQSQSHIIAPVEKEKNLVTILFGIISLIAVALVLCILYMIVMQKTRDIGIVKSIGGSSTGVALIFVFYGMAVGVVGGILGTVLGTAVVWNLNEIHDTIVAINPAWRVWDLRVYSFDRIPDEVNPWDIFWITLIGIIASGIGSVAAAWRAGSMQPVEALRYE